MKKYSRWKDDEIIKLFNVVEKNKKENKSLLTAFSEYAKMSGRKRNSVRNYYYQELSELQNNKNRALKLGINIKNHIVNESMLFSSKETKEILTKIIKLNSEGYSIRKACLTLANNDVNMMVRYQNKYRSVLKTNPKLIEDIKKDLNITSTSTLKENFEKADCNNLIYFKKQEPKVVSEKDINALFLGLIKLVKKSAAESVEKKLISELDFANSTLRKTLVKLSKTEQDLKDIEKLNENFKIDNEKLRLENAYLRSEIANLLNKPKQQKQKTLSEFISEIKQKQNKQAN